MQTKESSGHPEGGSDRCHASHRNPSLLLHKSLQTGPGVSIGGGRSPSSEAVLLRKPSKAPGGKGGRGEFGSLFFAPLHGEFQDIEISFSMVSHFIDNLLDQEDSKAADLSFFDTGRNVRGRQ